MEAFLDLVGSGKIQIDDLITHTFSIDDANAAYEMLLARTEPFLGVVLEYQQEEEVNFSKHIRVDTSSSKPYSKTTPRVGLIGAGSFAQNILLPSMNGLCSFMGVATSKGNTSRYVAEKFGFNYATCDADEILSDEDIDVVVIATRHDLHGDLVKRALQNGKRVFVEKPLSLLAEDLDEIERECSDFMARTGTWPLMVGYNRRFAPHTKKVVSALPDGQPRATMIRVNANRLPENHWVNDPLIGGGRIIGEVCHFVDLAVFIAGSPITSINASALDSRLSGADSISVTAEHANGSISSISYFSNGNSGLAKELIEVSCGSFSAVVKDFKTLDLYSGDSVKKSRLRSQDKGHRSELKSFFSAIHENRPAPISLEDILMVSRATFAIEEPIRTGRPVAFKNG